MLFKIRPAIRQSSLSGVSNRFSRWYCLAMASHFCRSARPDAPASSSCNTTAENHPGRTASGYPTQTEVSYSAEEYFKLVVSRFGGLSKSLPKPTLPGRRKKDFRFRVFGRLHPAKSTILSMLAVWRFLFCLACARAESSHSLFSSSDRLSIFALVKPLSIEVSGDYPLTSKRMASF